MRNIIVAPQPLAVEAGAEVFKQGGNAIDAAVGAAFAQGVIDPSMTSIGGFGTMLIYSAPSKKVIEIGFHGTVPRRAKPDMFTPIGEEGTAPMATVREPRSTASCRRPKALARGVSEAHDAYAERPKG